MTTTKLIITIWLAVVSFVLGWKLSTGIPMEVLFATVAVLVTLMVWIAIEEIEKRTLA